MTERVHELNAQLSPRVARGFGNIALGVLVALSAVQCVQDFVTAPTNAAPLLTITPDSGALAIGSDHPFTASLNIDNQDVAFRMALRVISGAATVDSLGRCARRRAVRCASKRR